MSTEIKNDNSVLMSEEKYMNIDCKISKQIFKLSFHKFEHNFDIVITNTLFHKNF